MARLVLKIDVPDERAHLWDPHEVIEDILANADQLPTFTPGLSWFIHDIDGQTEIQQGVFVSCEWETP